MNHRDAQILQKIIREIDIALEMVHGRRVSDGDGGFY